MSEFRDRLDSLEETLDCKQYELAEIFKVTPAAVSRWKNGKATPRPSKFDLFRILEDEIAQTQNPVQLKKKLLMVSHLSDHRSPIRLIERGELENTIREEIDSLEIFETQYLQEGMNFFDLTHRRITYWLKLAREGSIEVNDFLAWNEVLRFVPYLEDLIATLLWKEDNGLSESVRADLGQVLADYLHQEAVIPDQGKTKDREERSVEGIYGYMDATGRAASILMGYLRETSTDELQREQAGAEYIWSQEIWPGDESLLEALDYMVDVVQEDLLDEIDHTYHWKNL